MCPLEEAAEKFAVVGAGAPNTRGESVPKQAAGFVLDLLGFLLAFFDLPFGWDFPALNCPLPPPKPFAAGILGLDVGEKAIEANTGEEVEVEETEAVAGAAAAGAPPTTASRKL